jgi:hypothetical protein
MKPPGFIDKDFCSQKLDAVINLVRRLLADDYPHKDSEKALRKILEFYEQERALLESIDETAQLNTILEFCRRININIVLLKPFIGLLLRSSNLRNAFEIYFPIKVLAAELLDEETCVVLSSEWAFSPFTYPVALEQLPKFVFIGVPASECHNPLVIPLAAHELGHVVWRRKGVKAAFDPVIRATILDIYISRWDEARRLFNFTFDVGKLETEMSIRGIWAQSYKVAQRQLEEVFCDLLGVYVFGQAFLFSFRYLIAPSLGQARNVLYPRPRSRAEYMQRAAISYGLPIIPDFVDAFNAQELSLPPPERFIIEVADAATEKLHEQLPAIVNNYSGEVDQFSTGSNHENQIGRNLRNLVPSASVTSVSAIVNAAWELRLNIDDWDILGTMTDQVSRRAEKLRILRDLVLKSFEVYEFRKRIEKNAT